MPDRLGVFMQPMEYKGNFFNGAFHKADKNAWEKYSPADLKDHVFTAYENQEHVDQAVDSAREAFKTWSKLSLDERKAALLRLKQVYQDREEYIARCISRETGKALWETRGEAKALAAKIDITINASLDLVKDQKVSAAVGDLDGYIRYKPKGVMAIVGPFNFPAHLPNGHMIPALLTGNTVVFKPSEMTPATGQLMAEMVQAANLPAGVFNLVQGQVDTSKRLVRHDYVDAVLFTGSYETGLRIKQDTLSHYWKSLALEMGGKNASFVWKDADLDKAVYDCLFGAYASAGQRCSCTSRILLHKDIHDAFLEKFHQAAKKIQIGYFEEDVFYGPLINEASMERYLRFQQIAEREGHEKIMRGKQLDVGKEGYYVSPSIYKINESQKDSVFEHEEIFGPSVAVYSVDSWEQSIELINDTSYGLAASVFTKNRQVYLDAFYEIKAGNINWNRPTCGASSKLPFGGEKKSGNGWPSGHFAVYYCTSPVSAIEDDSGFDSTKIATGIQWD